MKQVSIKPETIDKLRRDFAIRMILLDKSDGLARNSTNILEYDTDVINDGDGNTIQFKLAGIGSRPISSSIRIQFVCYAPALLHSIYVSVHSIDMDTGKKYTFHAGPSYIPNSNGRMFWYDTDFKQYADWSTPDNFLYQILNSSFTEYMNVNVLNPYHTEIYIKGPA